MVFDWFKKKNKEEQHYDPTNIQITDLRVGFLLDYNLETYEVKDEYEYDWGDNEFTYEFKLVSVNDECFLHLEEDDSLVLTISRPLLISKISPDVKRQIIQTDEAPNQITYNDMTFYQQSESAGYFRNTKDPESDEFVSWSYIADDNTSVIEIEQWGETDINASIGEIIRPGAITNIFPGKEN